MAINEYLYHEVENSCALCGHKRKRDLTIHHIDENHSNNEYANQIILCRNCHGAFHENKGITNTEIINAKRQLIFKTITIYGINAIKIAIRNDFGVIAMPFLLYHLVDLGLMTKEEDQMGYGEQNDATSRFAITEKGKTFYRQWIK